MESVRSLFIPVVSGNLLIPNAAIAEIIKLEDPEPAKNKNAPKWLTGTINWREQTVPLVSYDVLTGSELPLPLSTSRIIVLKGQKDTKKMPYFAIVSQKIPRLVTVFEQSIEYLSEDNKTNSAYELCQTLANGEPAAIPDIEKLENDTLKAFG